MAESNRPPEIIDRAFLDRLNKALKIRGTFGDFVGVTPSVQPTLDVTGYLSGLSQRLDATQLSSIDLSQLVVIAGGNTNLQRNGGLAAGAYISRITPDNSSNRVVVNTTYNLTGSNTTMAAGSGYFVQQNGGGAFPGGLYRLHGWFAAGDYSPLSLHWGVVTGHGGESEGTVGNLEGRRTLGQAVGVFDADTQGATGVTFQRLVQWRADQGIEAIVIEFTAAEPHSVVVNGHLRVELERLLPEPLTLPIA